MLFKNKKIKGRMRFKRKNICRGMYNNKNHTENYNSTELFLVKGNTGKKVEELQEILQKLSGVFPSLPIVIIDGYYGDKTKETVKSFQELNSLPSTGSVDKLTWNKMQFFLKNRKDQIIINKTTDDIDLSDNLVKLGSKGRYVSDLQSYLNIIADKYPDIPKVKVDGIFGDNTLNSVLQFQKKFGLNTDGIVGSVTWDAIYKVSIDEPIEYLD